MKFRSILVAAAVALVAPVAVATATSTVASASGGHPDCPHRIEISVEAPTYTVPQPPPGWQIDSVWSKAGNNPHVNHGALAPGTVITSGEFNDQGRERDISHVDLCKSQVVTTTTTTTTTPPEPTEPTPTDPRENPCDPSTYNGSVFNKITETGEQCVDLDHTVECGSFSAVITQNDTPYNYAVSYSVGALNYNFNTNASNVSFAEGEGGGSVEVWYWAVGPEADFFTALGLPWFNVSARGPITVATECTPEPTDPEPTEPEATEPEPSEPEGTTPDTEPDTTEPAITDPQVTDPESTPTTPVGDPEFDVCISGSAGGTTVPTVCFDIDDDPDVVGVPDGSLPATGANAWSIAGLGLALMLAGGAALLVTRVRQTA